MTTEQRTAFRNAIRGLSVLETDTGVDGYTIDMQTERINGDKYNITGRSDDGHIRHYYGEILSGDDIHTGDIGGYYIGHD